MYVGRWVKGEIERLIVIESCVRRNKKFIIMRGRKSKFFFVKIDFGERLG